MKPGILTVFGLNTRNNPKPDRETPADDVIDCTGDKAQAARLREIDYEYQVYQDLLDIMELSRIKWSKELRKNNIYGCQRSKG